MGNGRCRSDPLPAAESSRAFRGYGGGPRDSRGSRGYKRLQRLQRLQRLLRLQWLQRLQRLTAIPLLLRRTLPFRKHLSFGVRLPEQLRSVVSQQLPIECERSWPPTTSAIPRGLVQQALPGVVVHEFVKASRLQGRSTRTARKRQFGMPKEFRAYIPFDPCDRETPKVGFPPKRS